ncbi:MULTISPECIES: bifunctional diaminohydroxyphosphoribosylaminopyrimidine deaminase/5-amino-6-(5-phosphoribosylamino)uracil reductase RibD [unclassified Agarivorans]|nr:MULTISPECIES: bifunctional diaminohydroxyphosphoribosylaminopyrimidine deaminase/5-amino-6-(5-phosphoribosylamino)uracil reductase RibD [unclassified Agarivorans]MDO6684409.1 bifunctional diaminohydroxyphosphoribosylaminopyrimidine deaminase/5-amino-6-(5-phosphoribosylamino)uracil reductase RibD [Agarivorans sp. 3_MG-2023]MDO6714574.1 bifunctional diaminohydroxyphosphoribosylaminopyrimidine deaminase/5-amino-6-(5-phosphoribosylamino)uracil reductase RibD [Agarivorans sp. 2_MG-2023]
MSFSPQDCQYMARALRLAELGTYTTAPNPNVGCVLVKNGQIIGEGYHQKAGEGHAEVNAVAKAKEAGYSVVGALAYVTLEPCSHVGRTPACASMLIEEQVAEVIIAMVDPNPQVAGRGIGMLEQASIKVRSGLMESAARALNPGFLCRVERKRPFVRLKLAGSIDAKTALSNGESKWITSSYSRSDVQRERARSHAILSTATTVLRDNASLNVRHHELGSLTHQLEQQSLRQPLRIVVDRQQRLSAASQSLNIFKHPKSLWLAGTHLQPQVAADKQFIISDSDQSLSELMQQLAEAEINDVWVEAGANFAAALIKAKLVDQLICYQAGKLMGADAQSLIGLEGFTEMNQLNSWQCLETRRVGPDIKTIWIPQAKGAQ